MQAGYGWRESIINAARHLRHCVNGLSIHRFGLRHTFLHLLLGLVLKEILFGFDVLVDVSLFAERGCDGTTLKGNVGTRGKGNKGYEAMQGIIIMIDSCW